LKIVDANRHRRLSPRCPASHSLLLATYFD
jgi:hypothetical protein